MSAVEPTAFELIKDGVIIALTLVASLLMTIPLTGTLVRLRANYNPRGLRLDAEGNIEPHTGPVVTSFFGMLRRVRRIEGWAGLYKGTMPTILFSLVLTLFTVAVLGASMASTPGRAIPPAVAGPFGTLAFGLVSMLLFLPFAILTYRAITTPYKLPYFRPLYSLRILLTPTERKKPWMLYSTPGLLAAQCIQIVYTAFLLTALRSFLVPRPGPDDFMASVKFGIYIGVEVVSVVVICPLEVITTKLAIQRNHAAPEYNSVEQEAEDDMIDGEEYTEYSGAEEDVIGLRHEKDPYLGLVDCAKRIVDEEGWKALYRAWWLTMLGGIVSALAAGVPYVRS
ncbi:uncharacterized protein FIBRA_05720 [Fibroporia radiculosa]|uniref:Mitochondrial carrier n=1 Tax=Fibroporia radiculosa TaxID=599839 RepID=J4G9Z8_9APHY|nr:uncharacterized protein FIBRA_05720 [Fibroporia radiculosa]CCM03583.1 predicted protein [Fibroporia radiculosa]